MAKQNKFSKIASAVKKEEKDNEKKNISYTIMAKIPEQLDMALVMISKKKGFKSKQEFLYNLAKDSLLRDYKDLLDKYDLELD